MQELQRLNPEQRRAVLHEGAPLLILAGAGSGKTRVITTKIAYLVIEKSADPMSILAVTFTNKAANEMKSRVTAMSAEAAGVMIRTFHSFGAWLLRRHSHLLGIPATYTICDQDDALVVLKNAAGERYEKQELRRYLRWIERAKDYCLGPEDDLTDVSTDRRLTDIYRLYQQRLEASGKLDFGDLIMRTVDLLRRQPEVRDRIRGRFRVVLVDEYQDANAAQFLLLKELYGPENYLCVVGDEDQSIYRFRGADVQNILRFPEAFPGTEIIRLEENYRSTQNILEAATKVVANNRERLGKSLWSKRGAGLSIGLAVLADEREEASFCAALLEDTAPGADLGNTAILYRNNYQSRIFETVFSRLHIPFRLIGTLRFAEREEVKDGLAYLAFLLNDRDEVAFLRIVNKPSRGIGRSSLEKVCAHRTAGWTEACRAALQELSARSRRGLEEFLAIMEQLSAELPRLRPAELVRKMLELSGLHAYYASKDRTEETGRLQNIEELVNAAREYPRGAEGLAGFLESLRLDSSDEDPYERVNAVNLITMHNTKGLEFDRVIVTGMEDGLIPHYREGMEEELELEEERRLFYVAMTRARDRLILTGCRRRQVFGTYKFRSLSRFLGEMPEGLLEPMTPGAAAPAEEEAGSEYGAGTGVYHDRYGPGMIIRKWQEGGHTLVDARFESGKTARFVLRYANLERISLDDR